MNPDTVARRELGDFYRIALEILRDQAAAELLRTTSASIGLRRLGEDFPALSELVANHVDTFGGAAKDVVDRLQVVVLRWPADAIEHLARQDPGGPGGPVAAAVAAPASGGDVVVTGMTGCRGRAVGPVKVIMDASDLHRLEIGDVLVTAASTTDFLGGNTVFPTRGGGPNAIEKAIAVVADEGGLLSHGAIVCRERGIPCVLGTETATKSLREGEIVEVDATKPNGIVLRLG